MSIEGIIKKLKSLSQFKDLKDSDLLDRAKEIERTHDKDLNVKSMFTDKKEKLSGAKLLRKYLQDFTIQTISDKNSLKNVIYLEIINNRFHEKLNLLQSTDGATPVKLVEIIHKNLDAITKLKDTLGIISKDKSSKEEGFSALELLKKKFESYREENQGSRTMNCPYCGQMVLLKIKMDKWDVQKHPFFKDRILTNKHLLKLYETGKITKEDVSLILECSTDYVNFILDKSKTFVTSDGTADATTHDTLTNLLPTTATDTVSTVSSTDNKEEK